ncbi:hypothetical protein ACQBAU_01095 [Propionibacteriaceae bacterium Y2011]
MPSLTTTTTIPDLDLESLVSVLPGLIQRIRTITFDGDDVARLDGERREGLRLVDGTAGTPGSAYRIVLDTDEGQDHPDARRAVTATLVTDDHHVIKVDVTAAEGNAIVELANPLRPQHVTAEATVTHAEVPVWFGRDIDACATIDLPRLSAGHGQVFRAGLNTRWGTGNLEVELTRRPDRHEVTVTLAVRPRWMLAVGMVSWPFLRKRAQAEFDRTVEKFVTDNGAELGEVVREWAARSEAERIELLWLELKNSVAATAPEATSA